MNLETIIILSSQGVLAVLLGVAIIHGNRRTRVQLAKSIQNSGADVLQEVASSRQQRNWSTKREQETLKLVKQMHKRIALPKKK